MKFKPYSLHNFRDIPQIENLTEEQKFNIEVVGTVLPFRTNNYVVDKLIDWSNFENDPFFILNFPQKEMLDKDSFSRIATLLKNNTPKPFLQKEINKIRLKLNPNPA
ncbi:MAG: lysine 2,3-aminomutase, partial [Prolixibacteraceae bacterium]|nr:lysine 2,3-aminomutase [Prolixibacteraceae bacterium]